MSEKQVIDILRTKRLRSSSTADDVTLDGGPRVSVARVVSPKCPLPTRRKSLMTVSCTSFASTVITAAPHPHQQPQSQSQSQPQSRAGSANTIKGTQGQERIAKWSSLLGAALMAGRAEEEKSRVDAVAHRIAAAIPGDRSAAADTFRVLLVNLRDTKNGRLRDDIVEGRLLVEVLVRMTERDLLNPESKKAQDVEFLERCKDTDLTEMRKATATRSSLFPCPSCKERDCTWTQKQTRSGDEPMTVFCVCNACDYKWKRY